MKKIIIVGASGFGREIVKIIEDINEVSPTWEILGFIDDNPKALEGYECDYSILGPIKDWTPTENEEYACALAFPAIKEKVVTMLKERGAKFATIIHPTALINKHSVIGEGVIISPFSNVNPDTKVGDFVTILGSGIGHDAAVGDYSTLSGRVSVNGHDIIGRGVYIACGVVIAPSKRIGDGASIGIGSVVISNVKAGTTVFGNPARKVEV